MPRMTLDLSNEVDSYLTGFAKKKGITKAEAMRRAFSLLAIADREDEKGNGFGIGIVKDGEDGKLEAVGRVVGI